MYFECIEKVTKLFGPTHEILRFCYESLIKIFIITGDHDRYDQYCNIRDTWEIISEEKRWQERLDARRNLWKYDYPDEWKCENVMLSDEPVKKIVRKLIQYHIYDGHDVYKLKRKRALQFIYP